MNDKDEIKRIHSFGYILVVIAAVVTVYIGSFNIKELIIGSLIVCVLIICIHFFPQFLKPFYNMWIRLGLVLGWVNTRLILSTVYFLMIMPTGVIIKMFGNDLLGKVFDKSTTSYKVNSSTIDNNSFERPY